MPMRSARLLAAGVVALSIGWADTPPAAAEETIRVATWNIANLHHVVGEALRPGAAARSEEDHAVLRKYARRMNADIVALQEVNGPRAARLVFPAEEYDLFFSGRYADDLAAGRESDRIYTGFAVRRGIFDGITKRDVASLGVQHTDGRLVRWGTEIMVERDGRRMRLLSVHLKSGCAQGSLENPTDNDCVTLAAQRAPLEQWIDEAARGTMPFAVLGDFNRRFDRFGQGDHFWGEIDDGDPAGLDLWRLPSGEESNCWRGTSRHFAQPIDFLVFDDRAWRKVAQATFREVTWDSEDQDVARATPSDHCPKTVEIRF